MSPVFFVSLQDSPSISVWLFLFPFLFLLPSSIYISYMLPSLPLHVGCVICKCADSCSPSPSFDSAVDVINSSANCDSSQSRWELYQPISTLYSLPLWPSLCEKQACTLNDICWHTAHPTPKTAPWTVWDRLPQTVQCFIWNVSFSVFLPLPSCHLPALFLVRLPLSTTRNNFSAAWPSPPLWACLPP